MGSSPENVNLRKMTFPSLSVSMSVCLPVLSCLCVVRKSAGPREKEPTLSHAAGRLREREHARSVDCHPALARAFILFTKFSPSAQRWTEIYLVLLLSLSAREVGREAVPVIASAGEFDSKFS